MFPCRMSLIQQMQSENYCWRLHYAQIIHHEISHNYGHLRRKTFSDECFFHTNLVANNHWASIFSLQDCSAFKMLQVFSKTLRDCVECTLRRWLVHVSYLFSRSAIIGMHYEKMIRHYANLKILALPGSSIFRQGGAPPNWAIYVHRYLDTKFVQRWTRREDSIAWLTKSLDLNLLDFFFWGFLWNILLFPFRFNIFLIWQKALTQQLHLERLYFR